MRKFRVKERGIKFVVEEDITWVVDELGGTITKWVPLNELGFPYWNPSNPSNPGMLLPVITFDHFTDALLFMSKVDSQQFENTNTELLPKEKGE